MQEKLRGRQRARTLTARSEISTGLPASRFLPSHFWLILVSASFTAQMKQETHTHTHSYCGDIHAASVPRQALCLYPELEIKARSFTLFFLFITESPTGMCLRMKTIMWGWNIWILKESSPEQEDALLALSDCGHTLTLSAPQSASVDWNPLIWFDRSTIGISQSWWNDTENNHLVVQLNRGHEGPSCDRFIDSSNRLIWP